MHMPFPTNLIASHRVSVSAPLRIVFIVCEDHAADSILISINHDTTVDPHEVLDFECHGEFADSCGVFSMCLIVSVSPQSLLTEIETQIGEDLHNG